jgi:DNA-binding MarR family transcriptional regulator
MSDPPAALTARLMQMRDACLGHATRRAANALSRHYNAALAPAGLEVTQFTTLCVIGADRTESAAALAAAVGIDRSTLARNLAVLRRDGLVQAEAGHGRRQRHRLTAAGTARLADAMTLWRGAQDRLAARLGAPAVAQSFDALARLRAAAD